MLFSSQEKFIDLTKKKLSCLDQDRFVDATVVDLCPGCASGSIDLSPVTFEQLATLDAGRIQVSWDYE